MQYLLHDLRRLPLAERLRVIEQALCYDAEAGGSQSNEEHNLIDNIYSLISQLKFWQPPATEHSGEQA